MIRLAQADIKTSPIAKPIRLGETMKMKVEKPAKAKLIATILVSPRRSDRVPPRRAPAPYRKYPAVAISPITSREAPVSLTINGSNGGRASRREWFRE